MPHYKKKLANKCSTALRIRCMQPQQQWWITPHPKLLESTWPWAARVIRETQNGTVHDLRSLPFFLKYLMTDLRVVPMNTIVTGDRSPERYAHKDVLVHHWSEWVWRERERRRNGTTHTTLFLYSFYADWHSMQHSPSSSISLSFSITLSHTHLPTPEDIQLLFELFSLSLSLSASIY